MNLSAATISFQVTNLGGNAYHYSYALSGFALQADQEVDIRFDPALYGTLSNGAANSSFSLLLLQPDNPKGTFGDYSALALVNNPSLIGPFGVDFIFKGLTAPGSQSYFINQYNSAGLLISSVTSGSTILAGSPGVPEPGSFWLIGLALLLSGTLWTLRRRQKPILTGPRP